MGLKAEVEHSQRPEVQTEANRRADEWLRLIALGVMPPPEPRTVKSRKHTTLIPGLPFAQRSEKGRRKMVKLAVLMQMAQEVQAATTGAVARQRRREEIARKAAPKSPPARPILTLRPRAPETPEQAQERVARINRALIRDLKLSKEPLS